MDSGKLRKAVEKTGMSVRRLAIDSGLGYGTVWEFMKNPERSLSFDNAVKLGKAAGITIKLEKTREKNR